MSDLIANDNLALAPARPLPDTDAHGHAAMLLVESLLHGLIARSVINVEDAVEIVAIAADAQREIDADPPHSGDSERSSLTLLEAIGDSIAHDLPI